MSLLPPISTGSAKFDEIGKTYTGELLEIGDEHQTTEYGTSEPAFWDRERTRPKMQRRFLIQTAADPTIPGDDGVRAIYAVIDGKHGSLYQAIHEALRGATALGGTLSVTFTGHDPESKNPQNPRKVYTASYQAGPLLADNPAPAPAAQQQAADAAAPAAEAQPDVWAGAETPPAGITPEAWAGMDDATKKAILAAQGGTAPF